MIFKPLKSLVKKSPFLANLYLSLREGRQLSQKPVFRQKLGFKFSGHEAMQTGKFEPDETNLVKQIFMHCDIFINIGANIGYYVCHAMKQGLAVIAFEPNYLNVKLLLNNVEANGWQDKLQLFPIALSDKVGILPIYGSGTGASLVEGWANQTSYTLAPVNRLDSIIGDKYSDKRVFIMVDVEGAEYHCLCGAMQMLTRGTKPIWMVEISIDEHHANGARINPYLEKIFQLFFQNDYKCYSVSQSPKLVEMSDVKKIAKTGINTLNTHNFIFIDSKMDIGSLIDL